MWRCWLGNMIEFIGKWSHGEEIDSLPAFLTATSPFYPELEALYQLRIATWIASEKQFYDDEF